MSELPLLLAGRLPATPFERQVIAAKPRSVSLYNRRLLASCFASIEEDYRHLHQHVQLWDVSCQVQLEVAGPDALALLEWITPRHIAPCVVGQCMYAPLVNAEGGMMNDPLIMRLGEQHFWVSIADSDTRLWLEGLIQGRRLDARVRETEVGTLAVQGPKAHQLLAPLLGEDLLQGLRIFRSKEAEIAGIPIRIARAGWSGAGGFEIYLEVFAQGEALWQALWAAGEAHQVRVGCPNLIDRIEYGLISYGNDITRNENPLEVRLERFCDFDKPADYMGREALDRVRAQGTARRLMAVEMPGPPCPPPRRAVVLTGPDGEPAGRITSMVYAPHRECHIGYALVDRAYAEVGAELEVPERDRRARVVAWLRRSRRMNN